MGSRACWKSPCHGTSRFIVALAATTALVLVLVHQQSSSDMASSDRLPSRTTTTTTSSSSIESLAACTFTRGSWCQAWHLRPALAAPSQPPPAADKACPNNCSGIGNCAADLGVCYCPAGWGGPDCSLPVKRPCTITLGGLRNNNGPPNSHIGPDKLDVNMSQPGWWPGRCAGVCDDDLGRCFCRGPGKHGRIPAPQGSPPGTPPVRIGRPTGLPCSHPATGPGGEGLSWANPGAPSWEQLYGREGWCTTDAEPAWYCGCPYDGQEGPTCDLAVEHTCLNQCSGRGVCRDGGFCSCRPGWFGVDCAQPAAGVQRAAAAAAAEPAQPPAWVREAAVDAWACHSSGSGCLEELVQQAWDRLQPRPQAAAGQAADAAAGPAPAAAAAAAAAASASAAGAAAAAAGPRQRRRPLIYVYHMPELLVGHIRQYRREKEACTWRLYRGRNVTQLVTDPYAHEVLMLDLLLGSAHRTLDPQEADFFYVPVMAACYVNHVQTDQDWPWFDVDSHSRVKLAVVMYQRALTFVQQSYPYWNASGGADHIWLFAHDEGACWAPADVYANSIIITPWGRNTPDNFPAHTNYGPDNYSVEIDDDKTALPHGLHAAIGHHRCYTPGKDIVVPLPKPPADFQHSPYLGAPPVPRDVLAFHRGRMMLEWPQYSLGVRQALVAEAERGDWGKRHNIWVNHQGGGTYSEMLARSVFCFVLQGDGFTARYGDAATHGCIPLIVLDVADPPFGHELDWEQFSVKVAVRDIPRLPALLEQIPPERVARLQQNLARVWHRFAWLHHPLFVRQLQEILEANADKTRVREEQQQQQQQQQQPPRPLLPQSAPMPAVDSPLVTLERLQQDAFQTVIQVLHARLAQRPRGRQRQ